MCPVKSTVSDISSKKRASYGDYQDWQVTLSSTYEYIQYFHKLFYFSFE